MENVNQSNQQVQQVLKYTYGLVPIVAGLDKFTNLLTNWKDYLSESVNQHVSIQPNNMYVYCWYH